MGKLGANVIKEILQEIYFTKTSEGDFARNASIGDDMFVESYEHPVDGEIGEHFDAHGIAKETLYAQMEALDNILTNGFNSDKTLYTAPFSIPDDKRRYMGPTTGTSGGECYKHGLFVLVGHKDKLLEKDGINFVVINSPLYPHIKKFQKAFPDVEFVCMKDANKRMYQEVNNTPTKNNNNDVYLQMAEMNNIYYDKNKDKIMFSSKKDGDMKAYNLLKETFKDRLETVTHDGKPCGFAIKPSKEELGYITKAFVTQKKIKEKLTNFTKNK